MPGSCWTRSRCECGYHVDLLFYDDDYVKLEQDKLSDKKTCRCGAIFEIWERKEDHEPFVRCRFKDSPDYEKLIRIEKKIIIIILSLKINYRACTKYTHTIDKTRPNKNNLFMKFENFNFYK